MILQDDFYKLAKRLFDGLHLNEYLSLGIAAEASDFVRFNHSRVRQTGSVEETSITLTYLLETKDGLRKATSCRTITLNPDSDLKALQTSLDDLRKITASLPTDPFAERPFEGVSSTIHSKGQLLRPDELGEMILKPLQGLDVAGLYAGGRILRGMIHNLGLSHWFETETFSFDFSLFDESQRAVKELYAGNSWKAAYFQEKLERSNKLLAGLGKPKINTPRGKHRAYFAPSAVNSILEMFSWGALSEASIQNGESPLRKLREESQFLSNKFSLSEDFRSNLVPRFTGEGELAPDFLPLISEGRLKSTLVSRRSAKEFRRPSTGASSSESLRSASIKAGDLNDQDAMKRLGDGLWISDLHYLNWSDQPLGRITGLTRYACMKIENGIPVGPLETMRFDDTLFSLLGDELEAVGSKTSWIPDTGTYEMRALGGAEVPGMLLKSFNLTL